MAGSSLFYPMATATSSGATGPLQRQPSAPLVQRIYRRALYRSPTDEEQRLALDWSEFGQLPREDRLKLRLSHRQHLVLITLELPGERVVS